jgi:hypothetical protein
MTIDEFLFEAEQIPGQAEILPDYSAKGAEAHPFNRAARLVAEFLRENGIDAEVSVNDPRRPRHDHAPAVRVNFRRKRSALSILSHCSASAKAIFFSLARQVEDAREDAEEDGFLPPAGLQRGAAVKLLQLRDGLREIANARKAA